MFSSVSGMIFRLLLLLVMTSAGAAECTRYETMHPTYLLTGSHLSTGKCNTCASCHKNGVFTGTPKTCVACHNGDPTWSTVGRSAKHLPTMFIDCGGCHKTVTFTVATMNHLVVTALRCDSCHNTTYSSYGARAKPKDHPNIGVKDCGTAGCHTTRTFDK